MEDLKTYSLSPAQQEPKTFSLTTDVAPPLTGDALDNRAFRYHTAMGENSPGMDQIKTALASGQEDQFQSLLQSQEMARRAAAGKQLVLDNVSAGNTDDPAMIAALADPGQPPPKNTIVEEQYTKKVFDTLADPDLVAKATAEDPLGTDEKFSAFEEIAAKNQVVQKWNQIVDERLKNTGWGPYAGYFGLQMLQFPTWANIVGNWKDGPESSAWTTGEALRQKVAAIRAMPPSEMDNAIKAEVEALSAVNPLDAKKFVDALRSYSSNDQSMNVVDDISMLPFGTAAKAGKMGVKAATTAVKEAADIKKATEAGKKLKEAEQAAPASGVAEGAEKAAGEAPKGLSEDIPLKDPVEAELEAVTRAASSEGTDIPTAMAGTGKPEKAMTWEIRKNLAEEQLPNAPGALQRSWSNSLRKLNSWASTKVKRNAGDNFHTGAVVDMEPLVKRFLNIVQQTTDVARVSRLPEEALRKAFELAETTYRAYYNRVQDKLLDIEGINPIDRIMPGQTGLNVAMIKMNFGKGAGELFESVEGAQQAIRAYGLPAQDTYIKQAGGKYYLETYATVGEDKAVDFILTPENLPNNNSWGWLKGVLGSTLGSKQHTSEFQSMQRAAVVHAETQLGALIREVYAPYEKLGKRSRKALDDIMRINQLEERIPGDPNTRGMYYRTGPELEKAFMDHKGRLPTDDEMEAYFAVVRAADLDWMYRSWSQYRLKAVQGFQNVTISRLVKEGRFADNTFEGRIIDRKDFPIDSRHDIDVLYIDEQGIVAKINLKKASEQEMATLRKAQADNWTFTQPYQVRDPKVFKISGDTDPVAFIVSPSAKRSTLQIDKQVNYRPGFHNEYKSEWFVKQPKVKNGRHEGDVTSMGFRTEAEAKKYGARMEAARILLKDGKLAELDKYLRENLPMDLKTFQKMFEEHLDPYTPFGYTRNGKKTTDHKLFNGKSFAEQFGVVDTTLDDLYNPSAKFGDPFVAQRDPVLWSVSQLGTEDKPLYELKQAELLSPMLTQTKAMGNLIKSELYNDYQLTAAQHWIETFADNLSYGGAMLTRDQLRRNPIFYLDKATVTGDAERVRQAEQLRTAIRNLVGTPSKVAKEIDHFKHKLMSGIYNRFGEKYLDYIPEKAIPLVSDPVSHLRSIAFHTKLGLFNPVQLYVQGAAITNVVAISPVAGMQSMPAMLGMRMLRLTEEPGIISKVAEHVAGLGGWSKEMFEDSYKILRKTGFDQIGSESAWRNDLGDPTLYRSAAGRVFLDKGAFFFNEGERAVRVAAWNTAYLEHAKKFPNKVGKFDEYDVARIRNRAQMLSGNMSRDANSWWQNHPLTSVTTQFWSYNVRMGELMLGKQLTEAERWRLALSQGMLWGVTPMAALGYAASEGDISVLNPFGEDIQAHAARNGIELDGTWTDKIYYGMVSAMVEAITGDKFDFGSRYGMSSPQVFESLERTMKNDGPITAVIVAAMGPSGSVVNEIFKESSNVFESMYDLVMQEGTEGALLPTDIGNALREISSVNSWDRLRAAAFSAVYRTQNGSIVSEGEDTLKDSISAIFGVESADLTESFALADAFSKDQKENEKAQKQAMRYSGMIWDAWQRGDKAEADRLRKVLSGYLVGTKLSTGQKLKLLFPQLERNQQMDKVIWNNMIEKAKGSEEQNLREEYSKRFGN